jgi:signal-transduction protein with cAMP-binding, CBS, and nucleotidyltransferase domain
LCREDEILEQLTPNLRAEVTHFAHKDTVKLLKAMKLFENLDDNLLTRLIVALTTQFMPPDELVCAEGELGNVLYIIRKGVVSVRLEFMTQDWCTPLHKRYSVDAT